MIKYRYTIADIWDKFLSKDSRQSLETLITNDAIDQWDREHGKVTTVAGETDIYLEDENTLVVELL